LKLIRINIVIAIIIFANNVYAGVFNNPYPSSQQGEKIYYTSFAERPKTLDPVKSYSSNEFTFIAQIYEPPLQYSYLMRPYQLVTLNATEVPKPRYIKESGKVKYSVYTIKIKPGIFYQPHPGFAKNAKGEFYYHDINEEYLDEHDISTLSDFAHKGTRELIADDYIYQIKRIANPKLSSPILGLMSEYILGMKEFSDKLRAQGSNLDLRKISMQGLKKIDDYTYQITIKGKYPQFLYWLAMPFFAPIPWEVDKFYAQEGMDDKNLNFNWYPVGTGPFMLTENNPNRRMVLAKNPNYHPEYFPTQGMPGDKEKGYLDASGKRLPLIEKAIFSLEKESIPRWTKFLQGYYDTSAISSDSFDQAIKITRDGNPLLTPSMKRKKIRLNAAVEPTIFYMGFNMLDKIVGGNSRRARKLRLAISIAINYEENIAIFFNGRGVPAQGPIPPGIFGFKEGKQGINPYVYEWVNGYPKRLPIEKAKQLMRQAGYKDGIDKKTGHPLMLNYDVPASNSPDDKARLDWMRKQLARIGVQLNVRATQYNRFQEKMRTGNAQLFTWGWHADYPDPENFLFLLYGPNSKAKFGGENASNYQNKAFDRLFEQMKNMPNNDKRQQLIDKMLDIVRYDAPWDWGFYPKGFTLSQQWKMPSKPMSINNNVMKYIDVDVPLRNRLRLAWNKPILWPIGLIGLALFLVFLPLFFAYRKTENSKAVRR
jgi:oligopeptide transport system substrate-binding protein